MGRRSLPLPASPNGEERKVIYNYAPSPTWGKDGMGANKKVCLVLKQVDKKLRLPAFIARFTARISDLPVKYSGRILSDSIRSEEFCIFMP